MNIKYHCEAGGETGYHAHSKAFWSRLQKINTNIGVPIHIILDTSDHPIFYANYDGIKICYNVYESTLQPERFFNHIKNNYDYFWCPSTWQAKCMIQQGFSADRVHVIPEGVDKTEFFPVSDSDLAGKFTFIIIGKYEYRKATEEMIDCWFQEFPLANYPDVRLILSVDNPFDRKNVENKLRTIEELKDPRVQIVHFPPRADYIKLLQTSHCFLSCSRSEGWNLPLIEALACGVPSICSNNSAQTDFATNIAYMVDTKHMINPIPTGFPGEYYEPDFEQFKLHMKYIYENWDECRQRALMGSSFVHNKFSWENAVETAKFHLMGIDQSKKAKELLRESKISKEKENPKPKTTEEVFPIPDRVSVSFMDGCRFEISGNSGLEYNVKFINMVTNNVEFSTKLGPIKDDIKCWAAPSAKFFIPWKIEVTSVVKTTLPENKESNTLVIKSPETTQKNVKFVQEWNSKDQRIFINLDSKALGDNIAWMPHVEEFRKKWGCKVICTTFWNTLFVDAYPEIEFLSPGSVAHNLYAQIKIGCYDNDYTRNKNNWREIPLQKVAADALQLNYKEIKPKVVVNKTPLLGRKYICISDHSTMQSKYWNYPGGWQEIVDYINDLGFDVIALSKDPTGLTKLIPVNNVPIEETASVLNNCEFFIGVGSGLSWLAWALGKKVIMISGFSDPFTEFISDNYRIAPPPGKCHGCFNDKNLVFARSWDWCPRNKNYECTTTITPEMVKEKIDLLISYL